MSDKINVMDHQAILDGNDYPAKAGMLLAEARHLRRCLETIVDMVTDVPNYADDPLLEGIVYVGGEAVETTEYLAYKPPYETERKLSSGMVKNTLTGEVTYPTCTPLNEINQP